MTRLGALILVALCVCGCEKDVSPAMQQLCYEWTGRTLGSSVLPQDKCTFTDPDTGKKQYDIEIAEGFKGHSGNPSLTAKDGCICEVTSLTFPKTKMPTVDEFKKDPLVREFAKRLGVEPDFRASGNELMKGVSAVFPCDGEKLFVCVSMSELPGSPTHRHISFVDAR